MRAIGLRAEELVAELHAIAASQFRGERAGHTLQPTAIVSEAWIRLMGTPGARFESAAAFRCWAASVVRNILVDHARARGAVKRGGDWTRRDGVELDGLGSASSPGEILELHDALKELSERDPVLARIVELRFFGGMTLGEIAEELGVDVPSVRTDWLLARAMIRGMMRRGDGDGDAARRFDR